MGKDEEELVNKLLTKVLYNKSTHVSPVKWAIKNDKVLLVYWDRYTENQKTMRMLNKLIDKLKNIDIEAIALEQCDEDLNWHFI